MANVDFSVRALRAGKRSDFKTNDWDDLFTIITALVTLVTELKDDHATNKTFTDEIKTNIAILTAQLDADAGVTDTDYAANVDVSASGAATLTAATPDTPVLNN